MTESTILRILFVVMGVDEQRQAWPGWENDRAELYHLYLLCKGSAPAASKIERFL